MPSTTVVAALAAVDTTNVEVTDNGADIVTVTVGDDNAAVRLTGPLHDVYRLVFEIDRRLARIARPDGQ